MGFPYLDTSIQVLLSTSLFVDLMFQTNFDCVVSDFSGLLFMDCKSLSMDDRRQLLQLMIRTNLNLNQTPRSVQSAMERSLSNLKRGDDTPAPSK